VIANPHINYSPSSNSNHLSDNSDEIAKLEDSKSNSPTESILKFTQRLHAAMDSLETVKNQASPKSAVG
jgi:hypothetical protein